MTGGRIVGLAVVAAAFLPAASARAATNIISTVAGNRTAGFAGHRYLAKAKAKTK